VWAGSPSTSSDAVAIGIADEPLQDAAKVPSWEERPLDRTLIGIACLAIVTLGLLEVCSGPQFVSRWVLGGCHRLAEEVGYPWIYDLPASWRGWYSLEIGVEISSAIMLGFLVWLLFALLYDSAGILVGLVPSSTTSVVALTFRFHLNSYTLLLVVPIVIVQALFLARVLDRRWHEQDAERAARRQFKLNVRSRRSSSSSRVQKGGGRAHEPQPGLSSRGHRHDVDWKQTHRADHRISPRTGRPQI